MTDEVNEVVVAPEELEQQPETQEAVEPEQVEAEAQPEKPAEESEEKPKKLKGVGKRLHQLTSERDYWRNLAQQASEPKAPEPQKQAEPEPLKGLKDFDYDDAKYSAYLFERAKTEAVEAARAESQTWQQKQEAERERQEAAERRQSFNARLEAFADEHPDLYEDWDDIPISDPMADAIEVSDVGPEITYYLKNNQDAALNISKLSPILAAKEIGRIEQRIVMEKDKANEKPVSNTPPPTPKIEGGDPGNVEKDPTKMSDEQFTKWRQQAIARRSGYS